MVILLYWEKLEVSELNVAKIVEFLGGEIRFVNLTEAVRADEGSLQSLIPAGGCVIARASTLAEVAAKYQSDRDWLNRLTSIAANCFIYGFGATLEHNQLLCKLTSGRLQAAGVPPSGEEQFNVEQDTHEICRHFAGLSFGTAEPDYDSTFVEGARLMASVPLIRIGKHPFFVSLKVQNAELLLLACREIADLDEAVPRAASVVTFFSRLMPLLMFLHRAGGERYWHNDSPKACLILDDPLLKMQYGFLNYEKLLELMEREHFSTSIAFIPWNYRRSNRRTVELFKRFPHRYTLCVHGCDHTNREFGTMDLNRLQEQADKGRRRMGQHRELTGIGFDDVMVFPQGCFSTVAMKALRSCGYLAAINSTPHPVDLDGGTVRLRDLVDVAVTKFSGFPLFVRRYPSDLVGLAFDLFLGKSALLVEHHGYFRNGYGPLTEIVQKLNGMEGRLEWSRLSEICSRACLKRRAANGDVHVRFYTDRFCLRNETNETQRYELFQRQVPGEPLPGVAINGVPAQGERVMEDLKVTCELNVGQTVQIQIRRAKLEAINAAPKPGTMRQASIFVRRHLSEFRDNRVDKISFLSRMASRVRNRLVIKK